MDWSHFGLARRPFRPAADPLAYFPAPTHEAAAADLDAALSRREPFVLLDGLPGTGKTLVARRWLSRLPTAVPRAVLPAVHAARPADLLQAILFDLNQPYQGLSEQELRLAVTAHLLAAAEGGLPTVLLVDEAQHLTAEALEELRLLANLDTPAGAAAVAVLVAQPVLRETLAKPAYAALAQRVAARPHLEPLTADQAVKYLRHQIEAAGGRPLEVFDLEALDLLARACGGVPRVLNQAAAVAGELAAAVGSDTVDTEAAVEALGRLSIPVPEEEPAEPAPAARRAGESLPARPAAGDAGPARGTKQKAARKRSA
ncbi:MAG: AAA family ATPase [Gemmataceae bacterium]